MRPSSLAGVDFQTTSATPDGSERIRRVRGPSRPRRSHSQAAASARATASRSPARGLVNSSRAVVEYVSYWAFVSCHRPACRSSARRAASSPSSFAAVGLFEDADSSDSREQRGRQLLDDHWIELGEGSIGVKRLLVRPALSLDARQPHAARRLARRGLGPGRGWCNSRPRRRCRPQRTRAARLRQRPAARPGGPTEARDGTEAVQPETTQRWSEAIEIPTTSGGSGWPGDDSVPTRVCRSASACCIATTMVSAVCSSWTCRRWVSRSRSCSSSCQARPPSATTDTSATARKMVRI